MRELRAVAILAMLLLSSQVRAQDDALPDELDVAQAVRLVRLRSLRLAAAATEVDVAEAERLAAGTRPNPVLAYRAAILASGTNVNGATQHDAWIEQPSIRPRLRRRRIEAASAGVDEAQARLVQAEAELALATRRAFVELLDAEQALVAIDASLADLDAVAELVRSRARNGAASPLDVVRIETEQLEWRADRDRARADRDVAAAALAALALAPGWHPRAVAGGTEVVRPVDLDEAIASKPLVLAAEAELEAAERRLVAERSAATAGPSVTLGGTFTSGPSSAAFGAGLSWPLPILDRNRAAIARARAEVDAAENRLTATRLEARVELEQRLARRDAAQATLDAYVAGASERGATLRTMLASGRSAGSVDAYAVLDGFRALRAIRERSARLQVELARADVELLGALGR